MRLSECRPCCVFRRRRAQWLRWLHSSAVGARRCLWSRDKLRCVKVPDEIVCGGADGQNSCGGNTQLPSEPLSRCGPCNDGVFVCASKESLLCVDATPTGPCGGCAPVPQYAEGSRCGPDHSWRCSESAATLVCLANGDSDGDGVGIPRTTARRSRTRCSWMRTQTGTETCATMMMAMELRSGTTIV